ncbi:MAG: M15 family metallopeptidase [Myxococcales bacterium]|nr:M15 family metallopeptidase [Myxococcales bacterium]
MPVSSSLLIATHIALAAPMLLETPVAAPTLDICELTAPPDELDHPAPVDCAESKDTGYKSGTPFEITVVHIDGKAVEKDTANAYWVMREAAAADGVDMHINSGFRTMSEQQYLYNCYINCNCNNCNLAAKPGYSNHQSGHALDLNTSQGGVYAWLDAHGGAYGFTETVNGEPWHWEWWGGGPGGGICDITAPPDGYLDAADCESVRGWAQDPDAPETSIDVHVYFGGPAGDPNAVGVTVKADEHRDDLCMSLGSCNHGYTLAIPKSLQDGAPHPVHAYGIDTGDDDNTQLIQSPGTITCAPPPVPAGVRRHVTSPAVLSAWKFDVFWQLVSLDDATLATIPEWVAIEPAPLLIQADDGSPEVWLVDGAVRRHVPSPEVAAAWSFDLNTVVTLPAADVVAVPVGTPVWPEPFLVKGQGPEVYVLDDMQCHPESPEPECHDEPETTTDGGTSGGTSGTDSDSSGGTTGATGGDDTADPSDDSTTAGTGGPSSTGGYGSDTALPPDYGPDADGGDGCACRTEDDRGWSPLLLLLLLGAPRRRR